MSESLDRHPLLSELTAGDRRVLEEYLAPREVETGSTLFRATDEAEELLLVSDGVVSIRSEGQPIAELGPGEALGALCLVSAGLRMCDAVAATPSSLLCLSRESYARLRLDQPALALQLKEAILRSFASLVRSVLVDARSSSAAIS